MFKYFARLHEKYQRKILPIVIYSHDNKEKEPDNYKLEFSFLKVLEFNFMRLQLNNEPWRNYIRSNNPVAAALISKMNYSKEEKISVKIEFTRMLANMQLDIARSTILTAFFENYVKLTTEEDQYNKMLIEELTPQEVSSVIEITTSYHEKGREEGIREGEKEGRKEVAKNLILLGIEIDKIMEATKLSREEIKKLISE
ncbi:conserved hypothetical protein (putative transposase or invertase) [Desulfonispora thiosulfatigenes DSM 11270]|uniref:Transposase (putative) YhgA-like domain-containing protein n=1 Tax=Desulfonispora thiosulfatigenes DSM 11270 TaxID=656914 RepID=A0A1W1V5I3_DESTI|nr:hypothetical protein [Desulfonispora thiosulfatigenes]SMB88545.1 conserved hypothetical protein (putative transposase or invertase) [Desulfonispora thiosulfatigenes DSM 11270]